MTSNHEAVIQSLPMPAILVASDGRITCANVSADRLFGLKLVGRNHVAALRHPEMLDAVSRAQGQGASAEVRLNMHEGQRDLVYRVHVGAVNLTDGAGALMIFEDVTPLEAAGQMRRDFVANVSHELKTPLTALLGFIETLRHSARDDAKARDRFLGIMERETLRMNRLVSDLLSLSRVEADERMRPRAPIGMDDIVRRTLATMDKVPDVSRVKLMVGDGDMTVLGDGDQLQQVIVNLLENALKYGRKDSPVEVFLSAHPNDTMLLMPVVRLDVTDQGEGIAPHHIPRLTERFYRVDDHRSRENGGTGLGLAIVKHIAHRHRGRLAIESTPGRGSRFSIILPAADKLK